MLDRGTVVLVELDPTVGHEQRGVRPCIAVSDPAVNADQRFPLIAVVPVTGTAGVGALYPSLSAGASGLTKTSYALIAIISDRSTSVGSAACSDRCRPASSLVSTRDSSCFSALLLCRNGLT